LNKQSDVAATTICIMYEIHSYLYMPAPEPPPTQTIRKLLEAYVIDPNPLGLAAGKSDYSPQDITKQITLAALPTNRSIHDISHIQPSPTPRTTLNWLYKTPPNRIIDSINSYIARTYARQIKIRLRGAFAFINIDTHLEPYWGKPTEWTVRSRRSKGSSQHMKIETFSIQLEEFKITLLVRQFHRPGRSKKPTRREIEDWVEGYIRALNWIKKTYIPRVALLCIVFDGEYFDTFLLSGIDEVGYFFITRATLGATGIRSLVKQEKIRETLRPSRYIEYEYVLKTKRVWPPKILKIRLIFGWKGSELVALVTNLPESFSPATIFEIYARRFWIENTYRDGRLFRVRTRSRRFSVRLAFFLIGLVLLNFFWFIRFVLSVCLPFRVLSLLVFLSFVFVGSVGPIWT